MVVFGVTWHRGQFSSLEHTHGRATRPQLERANGDSPHIHTHPRGQPTCPPTTMHARAAQPSARTQQRREEREIGNRDGGDLGATLREPLLQPTRAGSGGCG